MTIDNTDSSRPSILGGMKPKPTPPRPIQLGDLPIWRLIVAIEDAERTSGADSPTVRVLARELADRLRSNRTIKNAEGGSK